MPRGEACYRLDIMQGPRSRGAARRRLLSALLGVAWLSGGCVHLMYPGRESPSLITTKTEDGWQLALHHYAPPSGLPRRAHPVILCHGAASNRHNFDLTERISLANYLGQLGFDVWVAELRGGGDSETPGWFSDKDWTFTFDDHVLYDAPAVIRAVQRETGAQQVHWVGFSMGGMIIFGYLGRVEEESIRSAAAIGSPPWVMDKPDAISKVRGTLTALDNIFDELPVGFFSKLLSPLAGYALVPEVYLVWNVDNMGVHAAQTAAANAVTNQSASVLTHVAKSQDSQNLRSHDELYDYTEALGDIDAPVLLVAGALDHVAPPATAMDAFQRLGSKHKELVVFSRANGHAHDYGHVDLLLGESAPIDVYPVIGTWLIRQDGDDPSPDTPQVP